VRYIKESVDYVCGMIPSLIQLKENIELMEDYLGPRVGWSSDRWPSHLPYRWIMEYCYLLKTIYYEELKRKKKKKSASHKKKRKKRKRKRRKR